MVGRIDKNRMDVILEHKELVIKLGGHNITKQPIGIDPNDKIPLIPLQHDNIT